MEGMWDKVVCRVPSSPLKPPLTQSFIIWLWEWQPLPSQYIFICYMSIFTSYFVTNSTEASQFPRISAYFHFLWSCLCGFVFVFLIVSFFYLNTLLLWLSYYTVVSRFYHHIFFFFYHPVLIFTACLLLAVSLSFSISPPPFFTHCVNPLLSTPSSNSPHPAFLFCHYGYLF